MREASPGSFRQAWTAAYWVLSGMFILTAVISTLRIPAGFLSNYGADLTCPAWLYIGLRGRHGVPQNSFQRYFAATPERAGLVLFGGSTLTELSQLQWPRGFFAGTFDPFDIVAYAIAVGACYALERVSMPRGPMVG